MGRSRLWRLTKYVIVMLVIGQFIISHRSCQFAKLLEGTCSKYLDHTKNEREMKPLRADNRLLALRRKYFSTEDTIEVEQATSDSDLDEQRHPEELADNEIPLKHTNKNTPWPRKTKFTRGEISKIKEVKAKFHVTTPSEEKKRELIEKVSQLYESRRRQLKRSCANERQQEQIWKRSMQLITVPNKNLTVCVVQKAGSSSWHKMVYNLREPNKLWTGKGHLENRHHGINLDQATKKQLMSHEHGTRVLTVRHPFARLLSGWNNKFHKNHVVDAPAVYKFLPGIQYYMNIHEADSDHVIAFQDFVQYLLDVELEKIDVHFQPIENLCQPCNFPYNYVVKAETARVDSWFVLERVNGTLNTFWKHTATGSGVQGMAGQDVDPWILEKQVMAAFFRKIPEKNVKRLMEIYSKDFERFGYTFNVDNMMAGEAKVNEEGP